jgi:hypothetical protein
MRPSGRARTTLELLAYERRAFGIVRPSRAIACTGIWRSRDVLLIRVSASSARRAGAEWEQLVVNAAEAINTPAILI